MAMFGIMQTLVAPGGQDLAERASDPSMARATRRLGDGGDGVPVAREYAVGFGDNDGPSAILDLTESYSSFIRPAVAACLSYGQYAQ